MCAKVCFVKLEKLSLFIQTKWIKHTLAHKFQLNLRANFYSTSTWLKGDKKRLLTRGVPGAWRRRGMSRSRMLLFTRKLNFNRITIFTGICDPRCNLGQLNQHQIIAIKEHICFWYKMLRRRVCYNRWGWGQDVT